MFRGQSLTIKFYENRAKWITIIVIACIIVPLVFIIVYCNKGPFEWSNLFNCFFASILLLCGTIFQMIVWILCRKDGTSKENDTSKEDSTTKHVSLQGFYIDDARKSIIPVLIFWSFYIIRPIIVPDKIIGIIVSILPLVWTFIIAIRLINFCKELMTAESTKNDENVFQEVKKYPYFTTIHFLGTFLCICSLLTLSIAIYDESVNKKSLFSENYYPVSENEVLFDKYDSLTIYFNTYSSIVEKVPTSTNFEELNEKIKIILSNKKIKDIPKDDMQHYNHKCVVGILNVIDTLSRRHPLLRLRIKLIGSADPPNIGDPNKKYHSNYELSQSRALQVQSLLMDSLVKREGAMFTNNDAPSWYNLEWLVIPTSDDSSQEGNNDPDPMKRSVLVVVQPLNKHQTEYEMSSFNNNNNLNLLDYTYFMIYTITTTGYGDIKPIDGYIKFLVSIANIYEIFFLVIFFNVVISRKSA